MLSKKDLIRKRIGELIVQRDDINTELTVLKHMLHFTEKSDLTAEQLRDRYHYDPETGFFTWRNGTRSGKRAGCIQKSGYRAISIKRKKHYEHRLAWLYMTSEWPCFIIDHKNQNKTDNSFANLADVTWSQNATAKSLPSTNTSGIKGVVYSKQFKRWRAQATYNGRCIHIGSFPTKEEAGAALASTLAKNSRVPELAKYGVAL